MISTILKLAGIKCHFATPPYFKTGLVQVSLLPPTPLAYYVLRSTLINFSKRHVGIGSISVIFLAPLITCCPLLLTYSTIIHNFQQRINRIQLATLTIPSNYYYLSEERKKHKNHTTNDELFSSTTTEDSRRAME